MESTILPSPLVLAAPGTYPAGVSRFSKDTIFGFVVLTGFLLFQLNPEHDRLTQSAIGIQLHDVNALPVARGAFPTQRMTLARSLVEHRAAIQDVPVKVRMTLGRCHETDCAVTMFVAVPAHQFCDPAARGEQGIERL